MANPVVEFQIISIDTDGTARFYSELFGWSIKPRDPLGYRRIHTGSGEGIQGGIWPAPPQASTFVQLFIAVDDVPASASKAETLGAKILISPTLLPDGDEMAILHDPQGMPFALFHHSAQKKK